MVLGTTADGWRRYYCPVCGHVEWIAPGEELPAHYCCSLCGAARSVMLPVDDPRLARHGVEIKEVAAGLWQVDKRPPFPEEWHHSSYILAHPQGLILYDAPPIVTERAIEGIRAIGEPRLLVVSHKDFIGFAEDWAEALGIPAWMGEGEKPISGNRFSPDERVAEVRQLAEDLEVVPVPGHSPGSIAVYWSGAPCGPVLCCGDALAVYYYSSGKVQVAFFQEPPVGAEIEELTSRPVSVLAACGGTLQNADATLRQLRETPDNCARPWRGDKGGIWLDAQS